MTRALKRSGNMNGPPTEHATGTTLLCTLSVEYHELIHFAHSTLKPSCLPSGSSKGMEVSCVLALTFLRIRLTMLFKAVYFFEQVVALFKVGHSHADNGRPSHSEFIQTLPTYTWLANQGITPNTSKTYSLSMLTSAIKAEWGFTPALDCTVRFFEDFISYHELTPHNP
jgi:ribonuclease T2